jgi:hypothetical protein
MALGLVFYGLLAAVTFWRIALWRNGQGVSWLYLTSLAVVALVMTIQGYLGGELVYRYGVEVKQSYRELPEREVHTSPPQLTSSSPREMAASVEKSENAA